MTIDLPLVRPGRDEPESVLHWDPQAGYLSGPAADLVRELAATAVREGGLIGHPYPTYYTIDDDPLTSRRGMALVLGELWRLPDALAGDYPTAPPEREFDEAIRPFVRY